MDSIPCSVPRCHVLFDRGLVPDKKGYLNLDDTIHLKDHDILLTLFMISCGTNN